MEKLYDDKLEGSDFFQYFEQAVLEIYKVKDIQASSWVQLPKKYKNNEQTVNIINEDPFCSFLWCIVAHLFPTEDHIKRTSSYSRYVNKLNVLRCTILYEQQ